MRVNSEATENLAKAAGKYNPDVQFIFLSSVSVYGEEKLSMPVSEESECHPSSDYAVSKLDAERRLIALSDKGIIHNLIILRLAPVYDREWSLNLDRRVFAPGKLAYLRFGSGSQKMSALARSNLVDFIELLLERSPQTSGVNILNVCDTEPYEFNTIIQIFKKSGIRPNRPIISVPLSPVWIATRIAGALFPNKRNWLHSCYDKLALSLVFNNEKMLGTGFKPRHSLETIFHPQITQITQRNDMML
jgi:nucleoside-diphosphate-sugar epimerase